MKKLLLPAMSLALGSVAALAGTQWGTDPLSNKQISPDGAIYQDLPLAAATSSGETYISWLSWENENACVKLQLVDVDGNFMLDKDGIYVSTNPTPSWSSGYDITTDADGNAILINSDSRNGMWQAYVYKVSPTGEMLWNDGVAVSDDPQESCLNPKVRVTDAGNIIVAYQSLNGPKNTIKATKLSTTGKKVWGANLEISGTNGLYNLIATTGDSFYISRFDANRGNLDVMRYTANGEEAWETPVTTDLGSATTSTEPIATATPSGDILIGWRHAIDNFHVDGRLQCIDRQGNTLWSDAKIFGNLPQACADAEGNIYAADAGSTANNLIITKFDKTGNEIWQSAPLIPGSSYQISFYGIHAFGNGVVVAYRNARDYNLATVCITHLDPNGVEIESNTAISEMSGDKGRGGFAATPGDNIVVTWGDNGIAKGGGIIYAQDFTLKKSASVCSALADRDRLSATYSYGLLTINIGADNTGTEVAVHDLRGLCLFRGNSTSSIPLYLAPGIYTVSARGTTVKLAVR